MCNLFARLPLANSSFGWIVGPCDVLFGCHIPRAVNTQVEDLQVPSAVAVKTSRTTRFHRSCWRQQEKFIGAVKVADRDSSHPPHVQFGPIFLQNGLVPSRPLRMAQLTSLVLAAKTTTMAFSQILSLENCSRPMHCAEPSSPSTQDQVQFLSCISLRRLHEMLAAVPELSNLLVLHAPSSLSILLASQSKQDSWIATV